MQNPEPPHELLPYCAGQLQGMANELKNINRRLEALETTRKNGLRISIFSGGAGAGIVIVGEWVLRALKFM